mgnify:CR=1 FL=1
MGCDDCPLKGGRRIEPYVFGTAPLKGGRVDVLVVGEAPGAAEEALGEPFVGKSGKLLRKALEGIGVGTTYSCVIVNGILCRPPNNATPTMKMLSACRDNLQATLIRYRPRVLFLVGNIGVTAILGKQKGITKLAGTEILWDKSQIVVGLPEDAKCIASVHPAYVIRNVQGNTPIWERGIAKLKSVLAGLDGPVQVTRPETTVEIIKTVAELDEVVHYLRERGGEFAYDLETTCLSPWSTSTAPRILSLGLADTRLHAWAAPLFHPGGSILRSDGDWERVRDLLAQLFSDPGLHRVAHNMKFDDKWLHITAGVEPPMLLDDDGWVTNATDTMLQACVLNPDAGHGLDDLVQQLAPEYGNYWSGVEAAAYVRAGVMDYARVPLQQLLHYNGVDCCAALRMKQLLDPKLRAEGQQRLFYWHVMRAVEGLRHVEEAGLKVDRQKYDEMVQEVQARLVSAHAELTSTPAVVEFAAKHKAATGREFNPLSYAQIGDLIYNHLGCTPTQVTPKGRGSTSEQALGELVQSGQLRDEHRDIVKKLLALRHINKVWGTYLRPLPDMWDTDRLIHPTFNQNRAATGRLSCTDPNIQNQPPEVRPIYTTRFPDGVLVSVDYSQIEARVIACLSRDPELCKIFLEGRDLHIMSAARMTGKNPGRAIKSGPHKDWGEITPQERQMAKSVISFGILYGCSAWGLARHLGITEQHAQRIIDNFYSSMPRVRAWQEWTKEEVKRAGSVRSPFGRVRPLPGVWADDPGMVKAALRQGVNAPVQGAASDITLRALYRLDRTFREGGMRTKIIAPIHDQLLFDIPGDELEVAIPVIIKTMEDMSEYDWVIVPFPVEVGVGKYWIK